MTMTRILFLLRKRRLYLGPVLTVILFLIFWGFGVNPVGSGVIDQQCAMVAPAGFQYSVSDFARVGQEFIPSVSPIAGFSIVASTDSFNGPIPPISARILEGGMNGTAVNSSNFTVPRPLWWSLEGSLRGYQWTEVDFVHPLTVVPGKTYALDLRGRLNWRVCGTACTANCPNTDFYSKGDPYWEDIPGCRYCFSYISQRDFTFTIYSTKYPAEYAAAASILIPLGISLIATGSTFAAFEIVYHFRKQRHLDDWSPGEARAPSQPRKTFDTRANLLRPR
jgi:hypothetical protein